MLHTYHLKRYTYQSPVVNYSVTLSAASVKKWFMNFETRLLSLEKYSSRAARMCVIQRVYTDKIGIQLRQRVISENVVPHVHRCVAKLREPTRASDSRRECDKYNGGTRTDGAGSNPVGLENLYAVIIPVTRYSLDE